MAKAKETRELIIEKSSVIFNKYGYHGTSISQLAKAINMTKGAIYGNFRDKDELALAVYEYNTAEVNKELKRIAESDRNSCDKIIEMADFHLEKFSKLIDKGGCPVLNNAVDSADNNKALNELAIQGISNWLENIKKIIESGIKNGEIQNSINPDQFATVYVSLIEGGMLVSKVTCSLIHLSRNIDQIIKMVNMELRV